MSCNAHSNKNGETSLIRAIELESIKIIELLV